MRDRNSSAPPTAAQIATTVAYLVNAVSAIVLLAVLLVLLRRPTSDEDYVEVASAIPVIG